MNKTFVTGLVLLGIASVPVQAGELGLILDKQIGKAQALTAGGSYDAVSPTGVGVRAGFTFLDLKVAELGLALTYHPKAEGDLIFRGTNIGKFGNEYIAVGVQADWKFLLNLHAGVDMRSEKLTSTSIAGVKDSTTYTRPWVKAGIGFSVPTPVVSPFVRLEVAVPVTKEDKTVAPDDVRKALAPSLQVALYGGIRF
jgi:hypothetical protein